MKKQYEAPKMEMVAFDVEESLLNSGSGGGGSFSDNGDIGGGGD